MASSLLIEDPASGGFLLSHDLVRQTLEETLSANRRARMHARIAEVMQAEEQQSPTMLPEVVVEIARHLVLAESVVGANAAIPYLIAVADDARSRSAFHLVERALRTALELSARVTDPARRKVLQLELRTRLVLQSNVISGSLGSRIFGEADEPIDPGAISLAETDPLAWWGAQVVHFLEGRAGQALEQAEQASARELPDSVKAMVLSRGGDLSLRDRKVRVGRPAVRLSEELAEQVRQRTPTILILGSPRYASPSRRCGPRTQCSSRTGPAPRLTWTGPEISRIPPNELVFVEHFAGWEAAVRGDAGTALRHASAALELGQQLGDSPYLPMSRILVGWATAMNGETSGVGMARAAYAECEALSLRFQPRCISCCARRPARITVSSTKRGPWSWSRGRWRNSPARGRSTTVSSRSLVRSSATRRAFALTRRSVCSELQDDRLGCSAPSSPARGQTQQPGAPRARPRPRPRSRPGTHPYDGERRRAVAPASDRLGWGAVIDPDPQQHHHVVHATGHGQRRWRPLSVPQGRRTPTPGCPHPIPRSSPTSGPAVKCVWLDRAQANAGPAGRLARSGRQACVTSSGARSDDGRTAANN